MHLTHWTAHFSMNLQGRDFVVGDIHGMYSHLERLLQKIQFNPKLDRLFSVGDLVDRGDSSKAALTWLNYPWFFACRGNHDQMVLDAENPLELQHWIKENGGEWWLDLTPTERREFQLKFSQLPYAIDVKTHTGLVGIIHADVPAQMTWEELCAELDAENQDLANFVIWSRNRLMGQSPTHPVAGKVNRVYCGHTPVYDATQLDNIHYIDTGAAYVYSGFEGAKLTIIEIHPRKHHEYTIATKQGK